jgi:8-oxo-dGTP pyrophosphatase MutT (NUDIX family)
MNDVKARIRDILHRHTPEIWSEDHVVPAAVLIPIYLREGELTVLLTKRTDTVDAHKGQISFPGGAWEEGDANMLQTALRETHEEVGVKPEDIEVLGQVDQLISTTDFIISPFVGVIPYPYEFIPNPDEIAELLEVPMSFFLNQANMRTEQRDFRGRRITLYFFEFGRHTIWGVTARILMGFIDLLRRNDGLMLERPPFAGRLRSFR